MKTRLTLASGAVGMAAYMLTDIIHEVLGHGGAALLMGHTIDLISSVYFRSHPGSFLTDIGGPLANLLIGLTIYVFFITRKPVAGRGSFFLRTLMAYNFFWFSGTILESGFSKCGDWVYAIKELNIGSLGKPVLIISGIIAYLTSFRITGKLIKSNVEWPAGAINYSYIATIVAATVAGAFYSQDRVHAVLDGLLEAIGLLPILFVARGKQNNSPVGSTLAEPIFVFILFLAFCLTMGRGIFV